jgi:hypothetical protein
MHKNIFVGLVLAGLTGVGCTDVNKEAPAASRGMDVSSLQGAAASGALDQDSLATQAYARMQESFAARQASGSRFPVYELRPVGDVAGVAKGRARALGLEKGAEQRSAHGVAVVEGSRELHVDAMSGAERYVDHARFHTGRGLTTPPLPESEYISRAWSHVQRILPEAAARGLRPYKVRRYMNESAGPGGERTGATTYQIAVAFHETLAGLPVIGSGGKVAVHLTPEGEIISHESTVRATARPVADVSAEGLLPPDEARRQVEARLAAQGVNLADYTLSRAEFGYFRLGRNSVQSLLAPHYAYVYEPASREVVGKKRVEFIPAITDPELLARVRRDEAAEAARKAERLARAPAADSK